MFMCFLLATSNATIPHTEGMQLLERICFLINNVLDIGDHVEL